MTRCISILLAVIGCISCASGKAQQEASRAIALFDAVPPFTPPTCVAPNANERRAFDLAVAAIELEVEGGSLFNPLEIGAQKFLSQHLYRGEAGKGSFVCTPQDVLARTARAYVDKKRIRLAALEDGFPITFVARLPVRSPELVNAVGEAAFAQHPQMVGPYYSRKDVRPYARTVLATFGLEARGFGERAYKEMEVNASLGTGAAQVAAAVHFPNALARIEAMMMGTIASVPIDQAIPYQTRNRLYELALALVYSGEDGRKHTSPIKEMLRRKVENPAPPFGMLEMDPWEFCDVLKHIEPVEAVHEYPACKDRKPMPITGRSQFGS